MEFGVKDQAGVLFLLFLSVIFLLTLPAIWLYKWNKARKIRDIYKKWGGSNVLLTSMCLIGSILCLRFAVNYYLIHQTVESNVRGMNAFEALLYSATQTLQTFSTDEEYSKRVLEGKEMLAAMFPETNWAPVLFGVYASIINVVAPVFGGAIVFEILASIFPKIRLFFTHWNFLREKYYFSELNENSLALAKSIRAEKHPWLKRPVIIFTDCYVQPGEEKSMEMLQEAKTLGAICLRDDLSHIQKNWWGQKKFFLIDMREGNNLQTLVQLADVRNREHLKKAEIYLFVEDDAYVSVENSFREILTDKSAEGHLEEDELPCIYPIKSYRNLITNMLVDIPLFEPLIHKPRAEGAPHELTVTVLGTGHIGMEMIKSTYSFGQILDCNLTIRVLSQEPEEQFWSRLDYLNPEIRRTTDPEDSLLVYRKGKAPNGVYCTLRYTRCDVKSSSFVESLTSEEDNILDTDYFLVALGTDEDNISVANTIKSYIGRHHVKEEMSRTRVLNYVVYDSDLVNTLNSNRRHYFRSRRADVFMTAIGSLSEVYSSSNIFMTEHKEQARQIYDNYLAVRSRSQAKKRRKERVKDDYKYWADLARAMHIKYKIFSMGLFTVSQADYARDNDPSYLQELGRIYQAYRDIAEGRKQYVDPDGKVSHQTMLNRLAWLEHRRWNAFTRTMGFQHTDDFKKYCKHTKAYKHMPLKLHPCLVECDSNGVRCVIGPDGEIDKEAFKQIADPDLLDQLTYDTNLAVAGLTDYDFKSSDYPKDDFEKPQDPSAQPEQAEDKRDGYVPDPVPTGHVELSPQLLELTEQIAENVHENWSAGRLAQGWVYGKKRDDRRKTTPCLVPYDQLTEAEKEFDRNTAMETLKLITALGYTIEKREENE